MADSNAGGGLPEGIAAIEKMLQAEDSADSAQIDQAAKKTDVAQGVSPDELLNGPVVGPEADSAEEAATEQPDEDSPDAKALEAEAEAQDAEQPEKEGTRAEKRIRQLAQEKNQYKAELEGLKAQLEQQLNATRQQSQYQVQLAQYQAQLELQKQQAELAAMRATLDQFRTTKEEESLDPVEKFKRQVLREAEARAEKLAVQRTAEIEKKLAEAQQREQQRYEDAERQKRYHYFDSEADKALKNIVLKDFDSKTAAKLHEPTKEAFLAWCAAAGQAPAQAAKQFKEFFDSVGTAKMSIMAKAKGEAVAKNRTLPAGARNNSVQATATAASKANEGYRPSKAELRADGRFENFLAWSFAGKPPLRK